MDSQKRNYLIGLQNLYNIIIITCPVTGSETYFVIDKFTYAENLVPYHTIIGKDITTLIESNAFISLIGNVVLGNINLVDREAISMKIDEIPSSVFKYSQNYLWRLLSIK